MSSKVRQSSLLFLIAFAVSVCRADDQLMDIAKVQPSRTINHEVDLRPFHKDDFSTRRLSGPRFFSTITIKDEGTDPILGTLTWYEITSKTQADGSEIAVIQLDGEPLQVTIESPAFLITPAKVLTTGKPVTTPQSLNNFVAYQISPLKVDARKVTNEPRILGAAEATAKYLCIPVEEKHHDERLAIKSLTRGFLVFDKAKSELLENKSIIDQFGLNKLAINEKGPMVAIEIKLRSAARQSAE